MIEYRGVRIIDPGFVVYVPFMRKDEKILPNLKVGQKLPVQSVKVLEKST